MPAQGLVQAHVYTSDANLPVSGAVVSVTGENGLIALQITDSSGNTDRILVDTPLTPASLDPQHPGGYSLVTISAEQTGFERVRIENVQVFPDITTQQEIRLTPLDALPQDRGATELVQITPQPL